MVKPSSEPQPVLPQLLRGQTLQLLLYLKRGIAGMLLGSVSTAVVEFSPAPVVVVRGAPGA